MTVSFNLYSYNTFMLTPTSKIWHNGRLINWNDAQIHVLSHVVSYGSSVFEGIRCYNTKNGPAVFRAAEHARRLIDSAKIYRIKVEWTMEQLTPENRIAESVYLGLRTIDGLEIAVHEADAVAAWFDAGWLDWVGGGQNRRVRCTPTGWLRLDRLASDLTALRSHS